MGWVKRAKGYAGGRALSILMDHAVATGGPVDKIGAERIDFPAPYLSHHNQHKRGP